MDIGQPREVVEVEEPTVPYEGEEVVPDYEPEKTPAPDREEETVPA